jgi:hypothetical protein
MGASGDERRGDGREQNKPLEHGEPPNCPMSLSWSADVAQHQRTRGRAL